MKKEIKIEEFKYKKKGGNLLKIPFSKAIKEKWFNIYYAEKQHPSYYEEPYKPL